MTIDRYTKAVLTVIGISLAVIALQYFLTPAYAQVRGPIYSPNGAMWVNICNTRQSPDGQTYCSDIVNE